MPTIVWDEEPKQQAASIIWDEPDEKAKEKEQEEILSRPAIYAGLSDAEAGLPEPKPSVLSQWLEGPRQMLEAGRQIITHPVSSVARTAEGVASILAGEPRQFIIPGFRQAVGLEGKPPIQIPRIPEQKTLAAKLGAGAVNAGIEFANFFLTPDGFAALGAAGLPSAAQKGVAVAFGTEMATQAPEQYQAAVDAARKGDWQSFAEHTAGFAGSTALGAHLIKSGVIQPERIKTGEREYQAFQMPEEAPPEANPEGRFVPDEPTPSAPSAAAAPKTVEPTPAPERPRTSEEVPVGTFVEPSKDWEVTAPPAEAPKGEPLPETPAEISRGPATIEEILGEKPKTDPVVETLNKWIDALGVDPTKQLSDPLFVQSIGKPIARLTLIAAREAYVATRNVARAIEAGLTHLRYRMTVTGELGKFDENDARAWLKSVLPSEKESRETATTEKDNLTAALKQAEAAGEAGVKTGRLEQKTQMQPVIDALKERLSDSVTKATALSEHLRGQELGAQRAAAVTKKDASMIDRWLSADVSNIRDALLKITNMLPVSERGLFTKRITDAMQRPPLFKTETTQGGQRIKLGQATITIPGGKIGTIEAMYQKASKIAADIEEHIEQTTKRQQVKDIVGFRRWTTSMKIDVPFRVAIREELGRFKQAITNSMVRDTPNSRPRIGLSHDELQAYQDRLESLRDRGRSEQNVKEALWQWQKEFAERDLQAQQTTPLENRPELRTTPGDKMTIGMRIQTQVRKVQDRMANLYDKAVLPIDALFGLMDNAVQNYGQLFRTWLFRHARGPVDIANGEAQVRLKAILTPFDQFLKRNKLTSENGERIGIYAQSLQEGGRERLIEQGHSPEMIDRISQSITPLERRAYQMMRNIMDDHFPELQELMRRLYNKEVVKEDNYFPMPRDFDIWDTPPPEAPRPTGTTTAQDDLGLFRRVQQDMNPSATTSAERGMTIERQPKAKTPIRIDAFDIFREHMNDVLFLLEAQPTLKRLGEIGRGDVFRAKYGNAGQQQFLGWLDTVTRQGRVDAIQRWKTLDTIRNNLSVGMLGLKFFFIPFKHLTNWTGSIADLGKYFTRGLFESQTKRGQEFLNRNFAETTMRSGGEPAQAEAVRQGSKLFGMTIIPGSVAHKMFIIQQVLDRLGSQGSALGAYMREISRKGINPRAYDTSPLDRDAQAYALVMARRSIASPIAKDVPQALSRGTLTGRNVSWGRTLLQFQNIMLDLYSRGRLEGLEGIKTMLKKGDANAGLRAGAVLTGLLAGILLESGMIVGRKKITRAITGQPDQDDEYLKTALEETIRRVPGGGQVTSAFKYNEVPVPTIAAATDVTKAIQGVVKGRPGSIAHAIGTVEQVAGVPSEPAELIAKYQRENDPNTKKKKRKH